MKVNNPIKINHINSLLKIYEDKGSCNLFFKEVDQFDDKWKESFISIHLLDYHNKKYKDENK